MVINDVSHHSNYHKIMKVVKPIHNNATHKLTKQYTCSV